MIAVKIAITTDGSGDYTSAIASAPQSDVMKDTMGPKLLYAVEWVDGDLSNGVDAVLSQTDTMSGVDKTLLTLTNADDDAWYFPRVLEDDVAGADVSTYAMHVITGTLKLVVSSGGATHVGACWVYLLEA